MIDTACGYFLNATSSAPVLVSGYRVDNSSNSTYGETLLMRTLPLVTNNQRQLLYGGSINFKHINKPIIDALIVSSSDGSVGSVYRKEMPVATECMLSWCVKTLQSKHLWGIYEEIEIHRFFNTSSTPHPWTSKPRLDLGDVTEQGYHQNITIYPPIGNRDGDGYGVSNQTVVDIVTILDDIFPAVITATNATARPFLKMKTTFMDRVYYRAFRFNPFLAPNNVTHHMEQLAIAMTNVLRSDSSTNEVVAGRAFAPETYVAVRWAWLIFPLTMLSLCIVFLTATIIKTSKGGSTDMATWKTSAMPTLIYGLPKETQHNLTRSTPKHCTSSGAPKNIKIRLVPNHGWRVSGMLTSPIRVRRTVSQAPPGWL
jgi:hypothetical protein